MMIELNVTQGSPEWLSARAKCLTASEAPAMMGVSPYLSRSDLIKMKATGIVPEVDPATQRRFDEGHETEALARVIAEEIIGEDLMPLVATDDDGRLLASSDGATAFLDTGFEHKLFNEALATQVRAGEVPESHRWQLDQQCHVFGFKRILFVVSDGTRDNFAHCWYSTTPERVGRLLAGWEQFEKDLAAYEHVEPEQKPVGHAPEALPALRIEVTGMVTASNLQAFKDHALAVFGGIKTDLQTDADFADAEKTVKWCKGVEDKLDGAKQHALSQTASIDQLFSTIDAIKEEARAVRLKLSKLVASEKESRKAEIVANAIAAQVDHINALNKRTGVHVLTQSAWPFAEAIRGLKSLDSMRDKVSVALANAKIEANAIADRIDANRKTVDDMSLFPDFAAVCTKAPDDFAALLAMRVNARREAEEKRLEAERAKIRAEEQAKAQREALEAARIEVEAKAKAHEAEMAAERAKLRVEAEAREQAMQQDAIKREAEIKAMADAAHVLAAVAKPAEVQQIAPADTGKTITLGQINALIAPLSISKDGLSTIGFDPAGRERSAVLYREADVPMICAALVRHLQSVGQLRVAA